MNRFAHLGDNCRLQGMTQSQAQTVIDRCANTVEESDLFWEHFFYGTATEIVSTVAWNRVTVEKAEPDCVQWERERDCWDINAEYTQG